MDEEKTTFSIDLFFSIEIKSEQEFFYCLAQVLLYSIFLTRELGISEGLFELGCKLGLFEGFVLGLSEGLELACELGNVEGLAEGED